MKLLLQISVCFAIFWELSCKMSSPDIRTCPKNMKAYLVHENSEKQYCDCKETFLYNVKDDFCYDAYRQGPCPSGHYFVISPGELVAKCQKNPCRIDGLVSFQGECHFLYEPGIPCKDNNTFLGIDENYNLRCDTSRYLGSWLDQKTSKNCPKDSFFLPTDATHERYKCECKETFIYSKKNNACYQAYRQGPCSPGKYVVLPRGKTEPMCAENPCHEDGVVPFEGRCHRIYQSGPPCNDIYTELTVTRKTFQLKCIAISPSGGGAGGIISAPSKACPPGSRRVHTECKHVFQ